MNKILNDNLKTIKKLLKGYKILETNILSSISIIKVEHKNRFDLPTELDRKVTSFLILGDKLVIYFNNNDLNKELIQL